LYVSFIACCKCPGTCNTKHCPCQKDNSSCGAHCGCSSDKCKNRKKRPNILNLNFFTPPPSKRTRPNAPSTPTATPNSNNANSADSIGINGSISNREDTTSNKITEDASELCAFHNKYKCGADDGDLQNCSKCSAYVHRPCHEKYRAAVTMELGHNNVLQISDDDVYCLDCQPDNIPSPPNNNNNNTITGQLLNTPRGTSSRLSSTLPAPPAIPTPIEHNNNKSTQDVHQSYNFPFKPPTPRKKISEVYGLQHWPSETNSHYDLNTFGYNDGICSCGSTNMIRHKNTKTTKPILCNGRPRFVQSISLKCKYCNKTTMAYEKSYVDTLSRDKKRQLNAIIVGQSYGIDMGLIRALRNGVSADEVEKTARANLYEDWSACKHQHEQSGAQEDFPSFPDEYVPKAAQLNNAFLGDMNSESMWLKRELAALKSSTALSIDCQVKVVQRCVKKTDRMGSAQALSIVGDFGIVLSHVVVPSDKKEYRTRAMEEVVSRHDNPPKFCYVDKDCCNGKPGGRTDETKMYHGMEKKLDSKHLLTRITDTINSEHKRAAAFIRGLSNSIFTPNLSDKINLSSVAISTLRSLTPQEERSEYVRQHIGCGKKICSRILNAGKSALVFHYLNSYVLIVFGSCIH